MIKRKYYLLFLILAFGILFSFFNTTKQAHALAPSNYTNYLIDNSTMRNSGTMNAGDIQNFLNSERSGLAGFSDVENCGSTSGPHYSYYAQYYACGSTQPAAVIIYNAAQAYGINPRVILATLEK